MTNITAIIEEVMLDLALQPTAASDIDEDDYETFVKKSVRDLYVQTGRAAEYEEDKYTYTRGTLYWADDLLADEIQYIILSSEMWILDAVAKSVSEAVSYTTDALSVTGGDKPYKNIRGQVEALDQARRRIFYTMHRYTLDNIGV